MTARPNVLLIVFDSLSESDLSRFAADLPNLSVLRGNGLVFANAYAPSPESGPARASLLTGLDMAAHGVWTDGVALPSHEIPLPERFAGAGYHTWLVGRRQLAGVSNWTTEHARPYEYAQIDWAHGPLHRSRQNAYLAWLQDAAPGRYGAIFPKQANADDTDIPAEQRAQMAELPDDLSFNHWIGQQAIKRISGAPTPFFGVAGLVVGDTMGAPKPGPCFETAEQAALRQADHAIGALVDVTKNDPNLIIAITAGRGTSAAHPLHRDALRVPLILCGTNQDPGQIHGAVSTMDLAPTLYEIAGVPPPPRIQGQSLITAKPRGWAMARLRHPDMPHQTALITEHWKLVVHHGAEEEQLFDLTHDPDEANTLARDPAHQADLDAMLDQMIDTRVALEDRTEPRVALF